MTWIDYASLLEDFQITHTQFIGIVLFPQLLLRSRALISLLDACLLSGFDMISTFPVVSEQAMFQAGATFKVALDLVKQYESALNVIQHFASNQSVDHIVLMPVSALSYIVIGLLRS